jgi:ring-1,2-phenylacetyl-CoA epoxidase subunit PaaE
MASFATTLWKNWFGTPPPSVQLRTPSARWGLASAGRKRRTLRISEVLVETPTTKTFVLEPLDREPIEYKAGQHLTVLAEVGGVALRRCYSFSSCPGVGKPAITVKHLPDGRVSGFLARNLEAGQTIRVAEPSGVFTVDPDPAVSRHYVMIAGGVGITPLVSMTEAVLRGEPKSRVTLLYGNRSEDEIIFRRRLANLAAEFPRKLDLRYALDTAPEGWAGLAGPLTGERVLESLGGADPEAVYGICGPDPMMSSAVDALERAGVPPERIRLERFVYAAPAAGAARPSESFTVTFAKSGKRLRTKPGQPILQAAIEAGLELDYSCQMGGCGACKVKTSGGAVVADAPNCLTAAEAEAGYVLACCSYASADLTIEDR